jgi:hypothetical protein
LGYLTHYTSSNGFRRPGLFSAASHKPPKITSKFRRFVRADENKANFGGLGPWPPKFKLFSMVVLWSPKFNRFLPPPPSLKPLLLSYFRFFLLAPDVVRLCPTTAPQSPPLARHATICPWLPLSSCRLWRLSPPRAAALAAPPCQRAHRRRHSVALWARACRQRPFPKCICWSRAQASHRCLANHARPFSELVIFFNRIEIMTE